MGHLSKEQPEVALGKKSKLELAVYLALQVFAAMVRPYNAILSTHAILEYSDHNFDPEHWGVALTYRAQFDPGGTFDQVNTTTRFKQFIASSECLVQKLMSGPQFIGGTAGQITSSV